MNVLIISNVFFQLDDIKDVKYIRWSETDTKLSNIKAYDCIIRDIDE